MSRFLFGRRFLRAAAVLGLSGALAIFSGAQAALAYWRGLDAAEVPGIFASDAQLRVRANDYRFVASAGQIADAGGRLSQAARAALVQSPLNAIAMRQLGMLADLKRPNEAGWENFATAEGITARDLPNQIALINQSVRQGDIDAILRHYDRALRVYPNSYAGLFPLLVRASSERQVRDRLTRFAGSPWFAPFLGQMVNSSIPPRELTDFFMAVRPQLAETEADRLGTLLLSQLLSKALYADARDWLSRSRTPLASSIDNLGFSPDTTDPRLASLAWNFADGEGVDAALADDQLLEIEIAAGRHEIVAERTTLLRAGRYDLTQTITYDTAKPIARLSWQLRCLTGEIRDPIWKFEPAAQTSKQSFKSHFTVSEGCDAQAWKISARSDNSQFDSNARISNVSITKKP